MPETYSDENGRKHVNLTMKHVKKIIYKVVFYFSFKENSWHESTCITKALTCQKSYCTTHTSMQTIGQCTHNHFWQQMRRFEEKISIWNSIWLSESFSSGSSKLKLFLVTVSFVKDNLAPGILQISIWCSYSPFDDTSK